MHNIKSIQRKLAGLKNSFGGPVVGQHWSSQPNPYITFSQVFENNSWK